MKTIIAGGRAYQLDQSDWRILDSLKSSITEVVCGCAPGADEAGKNWAESRGILVTPFPADWRTHGRAAGPIRNRKMAEYAEAVILFPGGKGTRNMLEEAKISGLKILSNTSGHQ